MQQVLRIVTLSERVHESRELVCDFDVTKALRELTIPELLHMGVESLQGWEAVATLLQDSKTNSAGFCLNPKPHIQLGERFFAQQHGARRFVFCHELRHAYQALKGEWWKGYMLRRTAIVQKGGEKLAQEWWKFLSPPLEVDAQEYALSKFPEEGSATVLNRSNEVVLELGKHPGATAHTFRSTVMLLPMVYEWRKLIEKQRIVASSRGIVASNAQYVLDFLARKTRAGSDKRVNSFCLQYLQAEPAEFLDIAERFFSYLLTLQD
ncbi:MAG: hypothetical protein ABIP54_02915 [Candidatus Andersenbacteria bacterium]